MANDDKIAQITYKRVGAFIEQPDCKNIYRLFRHIFVRGLEPEHVDAVISQYVFDHEADIATVIQEKGPQALSPGYRNAVESTITTSGLKGDNLKYRLNAVAKTYFDNNPDSATIDLERSIALSPEIKARLGKVADKIYDACHPKALKTRLDAPDHYFGR